MTARQTFSELQIEAADRILFRLRQAVSPAFLGLVSASGHPISTYIGPDMSDASSICPLAASSFAVTKTLANVMENDEFTVMFHESSDLNVHIAQVSDGVLLVVCFKKASELGKVRLISRKAADVLSDIINYGGLNRGAD
ncbi:MAG: roadblock/LC7 domain-containing protein [Thermoleophilia bacterium]|nr:roadblock/LC7 domain-containing protein [Thermoleophilia bacterium]